MYDPDDYEYEESDESKIKDAGFDITDFNNIKAKVMSIVEGIEFSGCFDKDETKEACNYLHDFVKDTLDAYITKRQWIIADLSGDANEEHRLTKTDLV